MTDTKGPRVFITEGIRPRGPLTSATNGVRPMAANPLRGTTGVQGGVQPTTSENKPAEDGPKPRK